MSNPLPFGRSIQAVLSVCLFVLIVSFGTAKKSSNLPPEENRMKKAITSPNAPKPVGPYSHAVEAGNTIFVSGMVAKDAVSGELVLSDIKSETRKVMENLRAILESADVDFSHVVKTSVFLTDMNDFAAMNEVYGSYFTRDFPARETIQVAALPLGVHVEISLIAVK